MSARGLSDLFHVSSNHWDELRLKDLLYTTTDGATRYGEPKQSQVFSKVAYVFRDGLELSSLLDCLRTRGTFSSDECKEILRNHEQKYNRFYDKLSRLATTRKLTLLRSFYLSLLDSFEQCASSELDSNYSAAQHVRDAVLENINVSYEDLQNEPFRILHQKLREDPLVLDVKTSDELVTNLGMPELHGRRDMSVLKVFSSWYDKHSGSSSLYLGCFTTLIKALMLTKGLGHLVSGLKPMCCSNPPEIRRLFSALPSGGWVKIARYVGYKDDLIKAILNKHDREGYLQVSMFLRRLKMPDCGKDDNLNIFQELKRECQIEDFQGLRQVRGWVGTEGQQTVVQNIIFILGHTSGAAGQVHQQQHTQGSIFSGLSELGLPQIDRGSGAYFQVEESITEVCSQSCESPGVEGSVHSSLLTGESDGSVNTDVQSNLQSVTSADSTVRELQSPVGISRQVSENNYELLQACIDKDWNLALTLLDSVAEGNVAAILGAEDINGKTPLHHACIEKKEELATRMISRGAKVSHVDKKGTSILQYPTVLTNYPLLKKLVTVFHENDLNVDMPNRDGTNSPLLMACRVGALKAVELLIRNGANADGDESLASRPIIEASGRGFIKIIRHLIDQYNVNINVQDKEGNTALLMAARSMEWESVHVLLDCEVINVQLEDKDGTTPLFAAVSSGHLKIVEKLLQKGARINISRRRVIYIKEGSTQEATKPIDLEETPLSCACANGYYVIMKLLLLNGANINYICSGSLSALEFAIICARRKIVEKLLNEKELDTSILGLCQPIISSVSVNNFECAGMLIEKLDGPEEALKRAVDLSLNDLSWSISEYQNKRDNAPSCWTLEEDDLEESAELSVAIYRFCDMCVKALYREGHRQSPKELAEITKQTAPQLSQFFLKIANDQVDQKSLKKDFLEGEPISPLKYLVHNQYLTYDDFVSYMPNLLGDSKEFLNQLLAAFQKFCGNGDTRVPEDADELLARLFDVQYFEGQSDTRTSQPSHAVTQSQGDTNNGTFDAYKPKFGVGGKQNVKDTPRMLTPRETWQLKEKERKARSVQTMAKNKQRPTDEVPTNRGSFDSKEVSRAPVQGVQGSRTKTDLKRSQITGSHRVESSRKITTDVQNLDKTAATPPQKQKRDHQLTSTPKGLTQIQHPVKPSTDNSVKRSISGQVPPMKRSQKVDSNLSHSQSLPTTFPQHQESNTHNETSSSPPCHKVDMDRLESPKTSRSSSSLSQASDFQSPAHKSTSMIPGPGTGEDESGSPQCTTSTSVHIGSGDNVDVGLDSVIAGVKAQIKYSIERKHHGKIDLKISW